MPADPRKAASGRLLQYWPESERVPMRAAAVLFTILDALKCRQRAWWARSSKRCAGFLMRARFART